MTAVVASDPRLPARDRLGWAPFDLAQRGVGFVLSMAAVVGCYGAAKLAPLGEPALLPLTPLDRAIPFLPWTVWLYGTVTYACGAAWLLVPSVLHARRLWASIAIASLFCSLCFLFAPTTYPRALYPTPTDGSATALELADLRDADSPTNCLPSLHVALAFSLALSVIGYSRQGPRALRIAGWVALPWALAVTLTTLTTKQHYVVDLPAGALVGVLAYWLARRTIRDDVPPVWARYGRPLRVRERDAEAVRRLRAKVEAHQWSLDDLPWPAERARPLTPPMVRLLNEVIYIEEIARLNFELLRDASADEDLRFLYGRFADEERRHADGLRRMLAVHGAPLLPPGLGNTLVLAQFDRLDPRSDSDVRLVALATPVFETFLDAGTIPFLRAHPEVRGPLFDALEARIARDEHAHLALNWIVMRAEAGDGRFRRGLRVLGNPQVYRGIAAVPFMSLDVYALAARLGFDFRTLLPAFHKLGALHTRFPELRAYAPWWTFRLFVRCGQLATWTVLGLQRAGILFGVFWTSWTRVFRAAARVLFGRGLLARRALPVV